MIRRLLLAAGSVALVALALAAFVLVRAHLAIRRVDPPLPEAADLLRVAPGADLPIRLHYLNTASQRMPRRLVLDGRLDPTPDVPYVMGYAAFAVEWSDGRLFLIDAGMDRDSARAFGAPLEWFGGERLVPLGSAAERLGGAVARVAGVAFTHLHRDHTAGVAALCARVPGRLPLYRTREQAGPGNYTTRAGRDDLAGAACLEPHLLEGGPAYAVPGFDGLGVFAAAGHTPGSQVFVVHVRRGEAIETFALAGDVANCLEGIGLDLPKPRWYSLLVVPEAVERLGRVRRLLRGLGAGAGRRVRVLVSHDQLQLEGSGIPPWGPT